MTTRIATLNIRHGGAKSAGALATRLLGYDADILVVTEFRANAAGARLMLHLAAAGYTTSYPDADPKQNCTLVARCCRLWPTSGPQCLKYRPLE